MAKDKEMKEIITTGGETIEQPADAQVRNSEKFLANMRKKHPDITDDEELYGKAMENYDTEHEFGKKQRAANEGFRKVIDEEPEIADWFRSTIETGDAGVALLGLSDLYQSYMNGEIGSEEFKTKRAEQQAKKKAEEEADKVQEQAYLAWCEKKGYDPAEWMQKANDQLFSAMAAHNLAEAQFEMLDKMMNYDSDVETARVQGRNENITAQRKQMAKPQTDGMPQGGAANVPATSETPSAMQRMAESRRQKRNQL